MWCLETIKQINQYQAEGLNAYEAYTASGIRVLGDSARIKEDGDSEFASLPKTTDEPKIPLARFKHR
jgi:hypothetical protein